MNKEWLENADPLLGKPSAKRSWQACRILRTGWKDAEDAELAEAGVLLPSSHNTSRESLPTPALSKAFSEACAQGSGSSPMG